MKRVTKKILLERKVVPHPEKLNAEPRRIEKREELSVDQHRHFGFPIWISSLIDFVYMAYERIEMEKIQPREICQCLLHYVNGDSLCISVYTTGRIDHGRSKVGQTSD